MRQHHSLLDIGCGSLRGGRLFIPYLNSNCYYGVEPEKWLVKEGISKECGQDLINLKSPSFLYTRDFSFDRFNVKFDYILAQSVFSHTTSEQIQKCLNAVRLCLRDEHSVCAATFIHGEKDYREDKCIYPHNRDIFKCFEFTPFDLVKVVIIGQDPYHGEGQANGLAFSVPPYVKIPMSLNNIYRELYDDLNIPPSKNGYLKNWATQGVFLLHVGI